MARADAVAVTRDTMLARRVVRYAVAGALATAIYFVAVLVLVEVLGMPPVRAAVVATVVVIVTSYVVNRTVVFDTDRSHAGAFARFVAASLVSMALNAGLMHVTTVVLEWPYLWGAVAATLVVPPTNFAMNYLWAFRSGGGLN